MLAPGEFHLVAGGYPISVMPTIADIRHANLLLLIGEGHGTVKRFALLIDREPSQVSQMKTRAKHSKSGDPRDIGDDMARHIEKQLKLTPGWLDTPQTSAPPTGESLPQKSGSGLDMAQAMSQSRNYSPPPNTRWEDLKMGADLSRPFMLEVVDGAFGLDYPAGCVMKLDPDRPPVAGWPALFRDKDGDFYLRDYQAGQQGHFKAVARVSRGFEPLDNESHGLTVVAVMRGVEWP